MTPGHPAIPPMAVPFKVEDFRLRREIATRGPLQPAFPEDPLGGSEEGRPSCSGGARPQDAAARGRVGRSSTGPSPRSRPGAAGHADRDPPDALPPRRGLYACRRKDGTLVLFLDLVIGDRDPMKLFYHLADAIFGSFDLLTSRWRCRCSGARPLICRSGSRRTSWCAPDLYGLLLCAGVHGRRRTRHPGQFHSATGRDRHPGYRPAPVRAPRSDRGLPVAEFLRLGEPISAWNPALPFVLDLFLSSALCGAYNGKPAGCRARSLRRRVDLDRRMYRRSAIPARGHRGFPAGRRPNMPGADGGQGTGDARAATRLFRAPPRDGARPGSQYRDRGVDAPRAKASISSRN